MGCPFYVMERIEGIIMRKNLPRGLELSPDQMRTLCENLLDVQFQLHSIDYKAIGLDGFGKPEGYVKRQVQGWSERYRAAWTPDAPTFEKVMQWLQDNMPPDFDRPGIIHNDYKFDNVVLDPDNPLEIIGVLDWEMATIGDPLMDLGSSLGYWVQADDPDDFQAARMLPTNLPGALTRAEMVKRYADKAGISIDNFDFYLCFGLFRLAVIAQQIYYRFYHGQTKDERFKMLIFAIHILDSAANKTMAQSSL
jgi:aminoglycoside phosphotransferase (APT) family kinase protein